MRKNFFQHGDEREGRAPRRSADFRLKNIFQRANERELGFGTAVATGAGERLMNADGTMNVVRECKSRWDDVYHTLVTMPFGWFMALVFGSFGLLNILFAGLYCLAGVEHLAGIEPGGAAHNFMESLFFSTQTLTTVGYGRISPMGIPANLLASLESLIGLLSFALISGLAYGRFSRPQAKIVFSRSMVVAPFRDGHALMFRMVNASRSELLETEAQLIMAINQQDEAGSLSRRYFQLELEVKKISFFALSWTCVHAINDKSPLAGLTAADLSEGNAEIMVLVKGVEETNEQTVHARRSYVADDVAWSAKFSPIIGQTEQGIPLVFTSKIDDFQRV